MPVSVALCGFLIGKRIKCRPGRSLYQAAQALTEASMGVLAGEQLWRMPLEASYRRHLDSMIADIKNWSAKPGGGITAALFLQEFVSTEKARCVSSIWLESCVRASGMNCVAPPHFPSRLSSRRR